MTKDDQMSETAWGKSGSYQRLVAAGHIDDASLDHLHPVDASQLGILLAGGAEDLGNSPLSIIEIHQSPSVRVGWER
ncbi:MAG: hypothetical protein ACRDJG_05940, partial [Actinomycetota bacterium]